MQRRVPATRDIGLITLIAALILPATAPAAEPAPATSVEASQQEAKARYDAGVEAYKAGRYEEAVELFLIADRVVPSPALSFNVARAYEKLGNPAGALRFYRDYMRRAPTAANVAVVRARAAELEVELQARGVQQLSVFTEPPAANLSIDGESIGVTPWTGELSPGSHRLRFSKPGYADELRDVELPAAHALDVAVRLSPATEAAPPVTSAGAQAVTGRQRAESARDVREERRIPSTWTFVALGAGGGALVGAGIFELLRRSAESDAREESVHVGYVERYETMQSRQTTARVLAGVGGAFVLTGGVLLVLDLQRQRASKRSLAVACEPRACALLGSF